MKLAITIFFFNCKQKLSRKPLRNLWEPRTSFCLAFGLAESFDEWSQLVDVRIMEPLQYFRITDDTALCGHFVFILLLQFLLINI